MRVLVEMMITVIFDIIPQTIKISYMEDTVEPIKTHFVDYYQDKPNVIGVAVVPNPYPHNPLIDGLDVLVLVITDRMDVVSNDTMHVQYQGKRVLVRTISPLLLQTWLSAGSHHSIVEWLVRGEIVLERDHYLSHLRNELIAFPPLAREQKKFAEYIGFTRAYLQAKQSLLDDQLLDAHTHIMNALHHWARIVLIEEGIYPELAIWKQIKRVHPGVYKLYEELTSSTETFQERVELVVLACEFTGMNKMKSCCRILLELLNSREEAWSVSELQKHELFVNLQTDMSLILQKLVKKDFVKEIVFYNKEGDEAILELKYKTYE